MNINLVVVGLSPRGKNELRHRFNAAVEHGRSIFGSAKDEEFIGDNFAVFNANRLAGTWTVPTWYRWDEGVTAVSQPPVPVKEAVDASNYARVLKAVVEGGKFEDLLPNHMGIHATDKEVTVWTDTMGIGRCYYVHTDDFFAACNHIGTLAFFLTSPLQIDTYGVSKYAGAGFFMDNDSPYVGIRRMPPSHKAVVNSSTGASIRKYFDVAELIAPTGEKPDYPAIADQMQYVAKNLDNLSVRTATVYLSGGRDSRMTAGLWLSGGSDARVVTLGTLAKEADIATDLMSRFTPAEGQNVKHVIQIARGTDITQTLDARLDLAFKMWDGDAAPTNIKRNLAAPPDNTALSIGGVGGEIMHGYYYSGAGKIKAVEKAKNFMEFSYSAHGTRYLTKSAKENITKSLDAVGEFGRSLQLDRFASLDFVYMHQKLRRWGNQGLTSTSAILLSAPAFVRGCFNLTPQEKADKDFPVHLVDAAIPEWSGAEYYKANPDDTKSLMKRGLATFQTDPEGFFGLIDESTGWTRYIKAETIGKFIELARKDEASYSHESWLNRVLWLNQLERHVDWLNAQVANASEGLSRTVTVPGQSVAEQVQTPEPDYAFLEEQLRVWPLVAGLRDGICAATTVLKGRVQVGKTELEISRERDLDPRLNNESKDFLQIHSLRWVDVLMRVRSVPGAREMWSKWISLWWQSAKDIDENHRIWNPIITVQRSSVIALGGDSMADLDEQLLDRHEHMLRTHLAQSVDVKLRARCIAALVLLYKNHKPEELKAETFWLEIRDALDGVIRKGGGVFATNAATIPEQREYWRSYLTALDPGNRWLDEISARLDQTEYWVQGHQPDGHMVPFGAKPEPAGYLDNVEAVRYVRSHGIVGDPPTNVRFVDSQGLITGRSGWGETERDLTAETFWSVLTGPVRDRNEHHDLGRVTYSSQGINWLIDPIDDRAAGSEFHSGITVKDRPYRTNGFANLVLTRESERVDDYVLRVQTYLPVAWRRHITFARSGNYLVLEDHLSASRVFDAVQTWIVNPDVSVSVDKSRVLLEHEGKRVELALFSTQIGEISTEAVVGDDDKRIATRIVVPVHGRTARVLAVISDVIDKDTHQVTRNALRGNEFSFTVRDKGIDEQILVTPSGSGILSSALPAEEGVESVLQQIASGELDDEQVFHQRSEVHAAIRRVKKEIREQGGGAAVRLRAISELKEVVDSEAVNAVRDHGMAAALIDIAAADLRAEIDNVSVVSNYRRSALVNWSGAREKQSFYQVPLLTTTTPADVPDLSEERMIWSVDEGEIVSSAYLIDAPGDTLVVYFHGATDRTRHATPRFERLRSFVTIGKGPLIFFADPTLDLDASMILSWFIGDDKVNAHRTMAEMVDRVAKAKNVDRVVLVGNSGGGFAALQVSSYLDGVEVIAVNGQIDLGRYQPRIAGPAYRAVTGRPATAAEISKHPQFNVIQRFKDVGFNNRVLMVQNEGDEHHMVEHFKPFEKEFEAAAGDLFTKQVEFLGKGHVAPAPDRYVQIIRDRIDLARKNGAKYAGFVDDCAE